MADIRKYTADEALSLAVNSGSDALKVDIDNATISAGDLEVNTDAMETKLDAMIVDLAALEVLQTSTNTKLDTLETTLTALETDLAALEVLITAVKATTDKLDDCINDGTNRLKVDVEASIPVPVS